MSISYSADVEMTREAALMEGRVARSRYFAELAKSAQFNRSTFDWMAA
jgi:hypothetical protein